MDSPGSPRRYLPEVPAVVGSVSPIRRPQPAAAPITVVQPNSVSPSRHAYHVEEMANPYSSPHRMGYGASSVHNSPVYPNSVHGSPRNSPGRWERRLDNSPSRPEHSAIHIVDDIEHSEGDRAVRWGPNGASSPVPTRPDFSSSYASQNRGPPEVVELSDDDDDLEEELEVEDEDEDEDDDDQASYFEGEEDDDDENSAADRDLDDLETLSSQSTLNSQLYVAPEKSQPRRHKSMTRKEVQLVRGNLILDCPVPTKLYSFLPRRDNDEFVYMRYTACTCEPDDFASSGFTLRPAIYAREIQLSVCISLYNEDEISFTRTLHAVMKNIAQICQRAKSRVWGKEGWKKVIVSIVADGRECINPRILDVLAAMGVYQEGIAKGAVNGKPVKAHIFEYTTQVSIDTELRFQGAEKGIVPVQILFCLKEQNAKKINSHRWLFNGFCPLLQPNVCVLLDVGTKPGSNTLYRLWKAFDEDSNVAGACGEIKAMLGPKWKNLLNPLVAAQNFEYKMSNILDKPMESAYGYISVLPGALSAYRYKALENLSDGTGPLNSYFKGETLHTQGAGVFSSNMYLAEDRILCWELVAKRGEKWILKYVRAAKGETDVPDNIAEFISQRRRWLNGALFAAIYSLAHFKQIWQTDHSFWRKFFLHVEFLYQFVNLIFTFFSLANFYLAFYFVAGSLASPSSGAIGKNGGGLILFLIFKYICICVIAAQFILSLGNRPQGSKGLFTTSIVLLSIVAAYSSGCGIYYVVKTIEENSDGSLVGNNAFTTIIVSMVSTYGIYIVMSFVHLDPWHVFTSALQYFLLLPSYICTLQIYALCNTHDVTWGTKGDNVEKKFLGAANFKSEAGKDVVELEMPAEQLDIDSGYVEALQNLREGKIVPAQPVSASVIQMDYYREFRTRVVLVWMVANALLAMIMTQVFGYKNSGQNVYLKIILWSVAAMAAFRAVGSLTYILQEFVKYLTNSTYRLNRMRANTFTGK